MTEFEVALEEHLENTLNPHSVVKAQVGLSNVDNTRDMDKPVSTLQEERIMQVEGKVLLKHNTQPFTPTEPYHPATKEYVDSVVASHVEDRIHTQTGVHGLRYHESKLEYFDGTQWKEIMKPYRVMGVQVDLSNSNPETAVTYTNDAVGMTPGSGAWDSFFGHRPCLFKDGAVVGYLNPNDFTQFEDGTPADIVSGNAGDVMIEFPRRGLIIHTEGNLLSIKMTDAPNDPSFAYLAHTRGIQERDYFYLGAYKGFKDSDNRLRSLSGKTPTALQTIGTFRTQARANGAGYEQSAFYQLTFRQCMYLLKYKNLNSQAAVGRGYVDGNAAATVTGGTDTKGMNFGESTGKQQMKLFGLEDFWGNVWEWIDGVMTDGNRNILTATTGFNDAGTGYVNQGQGASENISGWVTKPQGKVGTGLICKQATGSELTYFSDIAYLYNNCTPSFGGDWCYTSGAGIFCVHVNAATSGLAPHVGSRLMYL